MLRFALKGMSHPGPPGKLMESLLCQGKEDSPRMCGVFRRTGLVCGAPCGLTFLSSFSSPRLPGKASSSREWTPTLALLTPLSGKEQTDASF